MAKRFKRYEKKVDNSPKLRINERIRIPKIRLVGNNFEDISGVAGKTLEPGIVDTRDARKWADELGLDFVEINP